MNTLSLALSIVLGVNVPAYDGPIVPAYSGEIKLPWINPATGKPLAKADQEFVWEYHWQLSPGSCTMLGCPTHNTRWIKVRTRVPIKKQSRSTAAKQPVSGGSKTVSVAPGPRLCAPTYYTVPQQPRRRCGLFCRLRGGG